MLKRNIIVIGASSGGLEPLKTLVGGLPAGFNASIFVVWHLAPESPGVLPDVLHKFTDIPCSNARDYEQIQTRHIYLAPPNHHLILEQGQMRVTSGPKENRFRPAIDPLFRSAAYVYGPRVVGVMLSGSMSDGVSGLWTIKQFGGVTMVQDPAEAKFAAMPRAALREVPIDYVVAAAEMAEQLMRLSEPVPHFGPDPVPDPVPGQIPNHEVRAAEGAPETAPENAVGQAVGQAIGQASMKLMASPNLRNTAKRTEVEIQIAAEKSAFEMGIMAFGDLTPYTCPECHGALVALREGNRVRYRCHTGHAFSAESLLAQISERIEDELYSALRGMEEGVLLLNHMGDHFAEHNEPKQAARYFQKANEVQQRARTVRQAIFSSNLIEFLNEPENESENEPGLHDEHTDINIGNIYNTDVDQRSTNEPNENKAV